VIVHELIHLLVPNHGRVFNALMKAFLPDWERTAAGRVSRGCGLHDPGSIRTRGRTPKSRAPRRGETPGRLT
jgi:hypothetical protein